MTKALLPNPGDVEKISNDTLQVIMSKKNNTVEDVKKSIISLLNGDVNSVELSLDNGNIINNQLLEKFNERLIGQDKAKKTIIDSIMSNLGTIRRRKGPIASLFFAGPTGVGKTESAKVLADILLGDEGAFTRIPCELYSEPHTVANLYGAPKSYVGYEDETPFSKKKLFGPYYQSKKEGRVNELLKGTGNFSIILFDEIEKADPKVHQSLLGMMDNGIIELSDGDRVDISNSIIIFTSNVGSSALNEKKKKNSIGFVREEIDTSNEEEFYSDIFKDTFSPEFNSRLKDMIIFHSLSLDDCKKIIKRELIDVNSHLKKRNIILDYKNDLIENIAINGHDNEKGARELISHFEDTVEYDLKNIMFSGQLNQAIDNGKIDFKISIDTVGTERKYYLTIPEGQDKPNIILENKYGYRKVDQYSIEGYRQIMNSDGRYLKIENGDIVQTLYKVSDICSEYAKLYKIQEKYGVDLKLELRRRKQKLRKLGFNDIVLDTIKVLATMKIFKDYNADFNFNDFTKIIYENNNDGNNIFYPYASNSIKKIVNHFIHNKLMLSAQDIRKDIFMVVDYLFDKELNTKQVKSLNRMINKSLN